MSSIMKFSSSGTAPSKIPCSVRKVRTRSTGGKIVTVFLLSFLFALTLLAGVWIFGEPNGSGYKINVKDVFSRSDLYEAAVKMLSFPNNGNETSYQDKPLVRTKRIEEVKKSDEVLSFANAYQAFV